MCRIISSVVMLLPHFVLNTSSVAHFHDPFNSHHWLLDELATAVRQVGLFSVGNALG